MCVQNLVPIGPQATTCIPSEGYTHTQTDRQKLGNTHTLVYRYRYIFYDRILASNTQVLENHIHVHSVNFGHT